MNTDKNSLTYRDNESLAELYHINTKLNKWNSRTYGIQIREFSNSSLIKNMTTQPYKVYPWAEKIILPLTSKAPEMSLQEAISRRRSEREFDGNPITIQEISSILQYSAGITDSTINLHGGMNSFRAYPSGGALYPLEVYIMAFEIDGIKQGLYHYFVVEHILEYLGPGISRNRLGEIMFTDGMEKNVPTVLFITSILNRTLIKYGDRGYRLILLEAGHMGQNIVLTSVSNGLIACPLAGFQDDDVNSELGIDGLEETIQYVFLLGKK